MLAALLAQHPDHLLMTAMNAVESADRQHTAAMSRTQIMQAPNEIHRGLVLPIVNRMRRHYK